MKKTEKIYTYRIGSVNKSLRTAINYASRLRKIKSTDWILEAIKEKLERENIKINYDEDK